MANSNQSLIEIAYELMQKKRKPKTLLDIWKEVAAIKGLSEEEKANNEPQFYIDFMLCGHFIAVSENKKGVKVWDLKSRQPSSVLDKEIMYINDDPYNYDEDVIKNELKDEMIYEGLNANLEPAEEDEEDDSEEPDEIEEELSMLGDDDYDYLSDEIDEDDSFDDD